MVGAGPEVTAAEKELLGSREGVPVVMNVI
jgi:hypothetical protein